MKLVVEALLVFYLKRRGHIYVRAIQVDTQGSLCQLNLYEPASSNRNAAYSQRLSRVKLFVCEGTPCRRLGNQYGSVFTDPSNVPLTSGVHRLDPSVI